MENASKALIMAGGVLIGVLVISLAIYLFVDFGSTSARINKQNEQKQVTQFNTKFTSYADREGLTIYDVITVAGYANENNKYYQDNLDEYKITVILVGTGEIQNKLEENKYKWIEDYASNSNNFTYFNCKIEKYHENGRVSKISFTKK